MQTEKLGRFGHHPDPACDFCVEVERIEGIAYERRAGMNDGEELRHAVSRALDFTVGGDLIAISAKARLREIAAELRTLA